MTCWVVWRTCRVHHPHMNVSCLWLAELYEQLVESILITKEIALDSLSSSLNSSSTMNFMTIMDSDWLSPVLISTHTLNIRVFGARTGLTRRVPQVTRRVPLCPTLFKRFQTNSRHPRPGSGLLGSGYHTKLLPLHPCMALFAQKAMITT